MEVFCLMAKYTHWRPCHTHTCDNLIRVCKSKEATVRCANEYIREMKRLSVVWKSDGDFKNDEVSMDDLFGKYIGEDMYDGYIFHTEYFSNGHRKMEHEIYIWKMIVEE